MYYELGNMYINMCLCSLKSVFMLGIYTIRGGDGVCGESLFMLGIYTIGGGGGVCGEGLLRNLRDPFFLRT